ncbi:MAG: hypothetical protein N3B13_12910, partial [Deltaproteobacteria bacterium]|nr:hypothetical protein [Deltaproteobacteria bacterium]
MDKQVKQFHIMTVGNSLINNFKHERNQSDINEVSLYDYLIAKEKMACAETNSFISFLKQYNVDSQICTIYLIGTDSEDNKMILNLLIRYFKEIIKVNEVLKGKTIPPMT